VRYGGNTACVEVETEDGTLVILDCGTGAHKLSLQLAGRGPVRAHMLIGHTHSDHIQGLPFFVPALPEGSHLTIYGPAGIDRSFPRAISGQMDYAYFPVPITHVDAALEFQELGEEEFAVGNVTVQAQNGPIHIAQSSGKIKVTAQNGPLSVDLSDSQWKGEGLEATTHNGPVSVRVPANFASGVDVEASGHSPFRCDLAECNNFRSSKPWDAQKTVHIGGTPTVVRVSTVNGPVQIRGAADDPQK